MLRMVDQINKTSLPQLTRRHTLDVEAIHRDHGIVEQVIAELKSVPLAHLPGGVFTPNAAWLACAVIAHGLTRAPAALAGGGHARTRTHQAATPIERCVARRSSRCVATGTPTPAATVVVRAAHPACHLPVPSGRCPWSLPLLGDSGCPRSGGCDACGVHTQLIHTPARIAHSAHQQNAAPTDRPGPGNPGWTSCSAAPCTTHLPPPPDHHPPAGAVQRSSAEEPDRPATCTRPYQTSSAEDQRSDPVKINGESRISGCSHQELAATTAGTSTEAMLHPS